MNASPHAISTTSQRIVDVLLRALAPATPDRIPAASAGSMNNVALGGTVGGRAFAYYETLAGGAGGGPTGPGLSAVHTHMTNTMNTPVEALETSIKALTPVLEVRSRRVGGATYQVPVEVPAPRARTLAVRWLVEFSRNRREKSMAQRLANELMDAQSQQGGAYKRKDDIFRMAQANKAFAHYRW